MEQITNNTNLLCLFVFVLQKQIQSKTVFSDWFVGITSWLTGEIWLLKWIMTTWAATVFISICNSYLCYVLMMSHYCCEARAISFVSYVCILICESSWHTMDYNRHVNALHIEAFTIQHSPHRIVYILYNIHWAYALRSCWNGIEILYERIDVSPALIPVTRK